MRSERLLKILAAGVALFTVIPVSTACNKRESDFPELPVPSSESEVSVTETSAEPEEDGSITISAALPYSEETVERLFKLYYAKSHGYWSKEDSGEDISLEFLDSLRPSDSIKSLYVPDEGVSVDTIKSWGDNMPDVFLSNDIAGTVKAGLCAPLQDYLYDNELFESGNVYMSTVDYCMDDGILYGIPYYCCIPIIYGNTDLRPLESDIGFRCSLSELKTYIGKISELYPDAVSFSKGYRLIPYLGGCFLNEKGDRRSYMLFDEYTANRDNAQKIFAAEYEFMKDLYLKGLIRDVTDDGADPVYSRNCALWVASSSEIDLWSSYYPGKLYFLQVPSYMDEQGSEPYLTLYPLCVSGSSENKEFAAEFAAFVSLDPDARLLTERLEKKTGFLPVIRNSAVWDLLESDERFGFAASMCEKKISDAYYSFSVKNNDLNDKIELKLSERFAPLVPGYQVPEDDTFKLADVYE